jgi:protein-tyrosine kinase
MSRIYDALRRANLERKSHASANVELVSDLELLPELAEPCPISPDPTENVVLHPWQPHMASLPTLERRGVALEQFRALRTKLYGLQESRSLKTILVCSSAPEEGKTFVTANLAISLAQNGDNKVLLIDGDLRRPRLHKLMGAPDSPGLADFLAGNTPVRDILQRGNIQGPEGSAHESALSKLTLIPSGRCNENSLELLAGQRLQELITSVAPYFNWILIDSAPVLVASDTAQMARSVDAVLLVVRCGKTPYEMAQRAHAALDGAPIAGVVLNDALEPSRKDSYYGNYYYGLSTDSPAGDES